MLHSKYKHKKEIRKRTNLIKHMKMKHKTTTLTKFMQEVAIHKKI